MLVNVLSVVKIFNFYTKISRLIQITKPVKALVRTITSNIERCMCHASKIICDAYDDKQG